MRRVELVRNRRCGLGGGMSEPIPAIQSAFLNIDYAKKQCEWAELYWEDGTPNWPECAESLQWAIESLQSAKAKIENHMKESE